MKAFVTLAVFVTLFSASPARAAENRYDVIAKSLMPFLDLLFQEPKRPYRALDATLSLGSAKGAPQELVDGARVRLVLARPDRLRVEGRLGVQEVIVCRTGDTIWAWPGSQIEPLLGEASGKKYSSKPLGKWKLPVADSQAVFLPALLLVEDVAAAANANGQVCRVLDIGLMPELARQSGLDGWRVRTWINTDGYKPVRISVRGPDWTGILNIDQLEFLESTPDDWWKPTEAQEADTLKIGPARYRELVSSILGNK
jgi:hypothetical protein